MAAVHPGRVWLVIGLRQLAGGIPQQEPLQAEVPGVGVAAGAQTQALALRFVQTPAHPGTFSPGQQRGQVGSRQAETPRQSRHLQQALQFAVGMALLRRAQQPFQRQQQRVAPAFTLIGDAPGNVPRMAACVLAEDGAYGRRKAFDVGHHHDDVARLQRQAWRA